MEYKEALVVLLRLLDKPLLNAKEKEAILIAIGTLDCGSLANNRLKGIIKGRKNKKKKDIE